VGFGFRRSDFSKNTQRLFGGLLWAVGIDFASTLWGGFVFVIFIFLNDGLLKCKERRLCY